MARSDPQVVLRCASGKHRVRLDDKRFWSAARCPSCKTQVDPTRVQRLVARGLVVSGMRTATDRYALWLIAGTVGYLGLVLTGWTLLWGFADAWWPGTLVLFGPRWLFLLPLLVLVPLAALRQRPLLVPLAIAGLVVLFPIMGFRLGLGGSGGDEKGDVRVMTFNVASGRMLSRAMWEIIGSTGVDIAAFQECGGQDYQGLLEVEGWNHHRSGSACLSTRFPIDTIVKMEREILEDGGGVGIVVRYTLRTPNGPLDVTNLHLETPREGLEPITSGELSSGVSKLRATTVVRTTESRRARELVDAGGNPFIVTGDFNMPVESNIYERYWSDLNNAFNAVGRGIGATRYNGWIRARIDHVLFSDGLAAVRSYVGPDFGSDHRPLIADLNWRR